MAKSDLLKEAIADAKAVKETALANAKIALQEAFAPRLERMLATKLTNEIEGEEEEMPAEEEMPMEEAKKDREETEKMKHMEEELAEAIETINVLKSELNEINLLNSKLLYTNKIFKAKNLTESQKVKVLTAFDKAETVKEVKLVFETLQEGLERANKKELVRENKGFASKAIGISPKQPVVEANDMVNRFKKLAGL